MATTGTSVGLSTSTMPSSNNTYSSSNNTTVNMNIPQGSQSVSSLPVQNNIQQAGTNIDQWQQDSLERALSNASQSSKDPEPDSSKSTIQTTGKSGWCFIGEDQGIRTCAEIGVNDGCMSGDVFPNQAICMNPNLRT
jgi:hypothetical protein